MPLRRTSSAFGQSPMNATRRLESIGGLQSKGIEVKVIEYSFLLRACIDSAGRRAHRDVQRVSPGICGRCEIARCARSLEIYQCPTWRDVSGRDDEELDLMTDGIDWRVLRDRFPDRIRRDFGRIR